MKIKNKQIYNKGFTLVETMVAVFILTIALTSLLSLTSKSLFTARYSRNEITASYLLQEGVDYIRNMRDSVAFQQKFSEGGGWDAFLAKFGAPSGPCFSSNNNGCYFETNKSLDIKSCGSTPAFGEIKCPLFKYDDNTNSSSFYNYSTGITSNFKRKIFLKKNDGNPDELYVSVTVEWLNGNIVRSRSLNVSLLNWFN